MYKTRPHWSTMIGTWGKVKWMRLIYAGGMYDRSFKYVYVSNLNRRKESSPLWWTGFSYGQVRAQAEGGETRPSTCEAENATRGNRYALVGPWPSACKPSLYPCIVTIESSRKPMLLGRAQIHACTTSIHLASDIDQPSHASITFSTAPSLYIISRMTAVED